MKSAGVTSGLLLLAVFALISIAGEAFADQGARSGAPLVKKDNQTAENESGQATRSVIINGKTLSLREIETLERKHNIQAVDGNYWYDRKNGSWGREGGPADGFIKAGLKIGGPLREDASKGDTGVFINGRQLHRIDVLRLMQIVPVYQGRYWMDAKGYLGLEGGPALINIWAVAAQAQGGGARKEGILSTYDKTGVAVFGY